MPVTATRLTEVLARNTHPLEISWRGQHPLQEHPVAGLELGPLAQSAPRVLDPHRKGVSHLLQLSQAKHARLRQRGRDLCIDCETRKGLGHQRRKLPLEPPNLPSQLNSSEAVLAGFARRGAAIHPKRRPTLWIQLRPTLSVEQITHSQFECRSPRLSPKRVPG